MNVKEYLQQVKRLDVAINQKIKEKDDLLRRARSISAVDYSKDKSGSSSEPMFVKLTDRAQELEREIQIEIDRFCDKKHEIINQIQNLNDDRYMNVLFKRYIEYKSCEQIADEMAYSLPYVKELHKKSLSVFESSYPFLLSSVL